MENNNVTIINGSEKYRDDVIKLCDESFGPGLITPAVFSHWMERPEFFQIALKGDVFAGFIAMFPADEDTIMRRLKMPREDVRKYVKQRPCLFYNSAAIRKEFEHQGIVSLLQKQAFENARNAGYRVLIGSAWIHDGFTPIAALVDRYGFRPIYKRKLIWYDIKEYYCVVCRGRCVCDAMIYYAEI